jgi:NAD(P)-dependent dehydrogenase (short-subunit alcohol dehydrogenase family)
MNRMEGRTALVTGASSGIGRATALQLAREGAAVALVALPGDDLDAAAAACEAQGVATITAPTDVGDSAAVAAAFERASELGPIDAVVNNAGIYIVATIAETTDEQWAELVRVNLTGNFYVGRQAARVMSQNGYGAIVNTGSELALMGETRTGAYTATKGGVLAMTRALAADLAPSGIRVNAVCPGPIETPLLQKEVGDAGDHRRTEIEQSVLMRRIGEADEVAKLVVFLLSDDAAYITGSQVTIDGGRTTCFPPV